MSKPLNTAKVAEQLDAIAEQIIALAGTFRAAGAGGGNSGDDAPAGGKGGRTKPAATGKSKPAPTETTDDEVTEDSLREALKELATSHGKDVMVAALEAVGAGKLADVDESQYQELMDKVNELKAESPDADDPPTPAKGKSAAKGKTKKPAGPTLEQVQEAAKALIEADKAAYLKIAKKLGKPSEMDESGYADAIAAYEAAMPSDAEEDDDNLL